MFLKPEKVIGQLGITHGHHVADLGSGPGFFTFACAQAVGEKGQVYAVDVHEELLRKIATQAEEQNIDHITILEGDLNKPKGTHLADNCVHVALVVNVLFQLETPEVCAQEAVRVVEPGGRIVVIDWSESFGGIGPQPDQVVSADSARKMFEEVGAMYAEDIQVGQYHYGFVYTVPKS